MNKIKMFRTHYKAAVTGSASVILLLCATACTDTEVSQRALTQLSSITPKSTQVEATYSLASIPDIYALWERNQIAAIDKYNDKTTQITGVVNGIYNDRAGRLEIKDRND